ncbi:putative disease resistance RPP13-like protein 1, partial [Morus notabilis]|uniref:putative disease resistance RPP13-like protein 1 n=1 Tax=Morus notabilis TaxID=981085 RepID=UPI000CED5F9D
MKLLLPDNGSSSENKISVIPIVGMGGIGKTTLAQLVYEDISVKSQFDIRSWVTVSDESEISVIAKKILQEITSQKCETGGLYQLQCELKESLSGKRFLFVLDDVWTENYEHWEALLSSFQSGANGSGIIVTTRSDIVTKRMGNVPTHHLGEVSDDDCWKLFEEHEFINGARSEAYQELHAIGRNIVKKCKGVPLAVKSLAGLLRSVVDPEEWREILNSDIWELQLQGNQSNNILPSLWLSYHYLPSHLKKCFAYCSIFPKDYEMYEFRKEEIIRLWMAEGLLQSGRRGKRIEDVGNEYFQDLISRSLFQPSSKDKSTILMHDLSHDLATFVSGEFSCRLDDGDKAKFSGKTRHVSYSKTKEWESFEGLSMAKSLRTFIQSGSLETISIQFQQLERLLSIGGCLRALCLSESGIIILPDSIGNLKHLRYLDLSWNGNIKEIPNTLCRLYNLQTLRLSWCGQLTRLPNDMRDLVNLRHLEIEGVSLEEMPPMMRNMKDLQTLCYFVLCKRRGSSIKDLQELAINSSIGETIRPRLAISGRYENVTKFPETLLPTTLTSLYIERLENLKVLNGEGFEHLTSLKVLMIEDCKELQCFPGEMLPTSLTTLDLESLNNLEDLGKGLQHLTSLKKLTIFYCKSLRCLSGTGLPASLTYLRIINLPSLEDIGDDFLRHLISLEELQIRDCQNLEYNAVEENGKGVLEQLISLKKLLLGNCEKLQSLLEEQLPTSLTSLKIAGFPRLRDLNRMGFQHLCSLRDLMIENCENLECLPDLLSSLDSLRISRCPLGLWADGIRMLIAVYPLVIHNFRFWFPRLTTMVLFGIAYVNNRKLRSSASKERLPAVELTQRILLEESTLSPRSPSDQCKALQKLNLFEYIDGIQHHVALPPDCTALVDTLR